MYLFLVNKIRELFRFSLVGAFVMLLSVIISYLFLELLKTPLVPTYILLYISTIFLSYKLNATYTFKARQDLSWLIKFYGVFRECAGNLISQMVSFHKLGDLYHGASFHHTLQLYPL